jgi:hypothetical protein
MNDKKLIIKTEIPIPQNQQFSSIRTSPSKKNKNKIILMNVQFNFFDNYSSISTNDTKIELKNNSENRKKVKKRFF